MTRFPLRYNVMPEKNRSVYEPESLTDEPPFTHRRIRMWSNHTPGRFDGRKGEVLCTRRAQKAAFVSGRQDLIQNASIESFLKRPRHAYAVAASGSPAIRCSRVAPKREWRRWLPDPSAPVFQLLL